MFQTSSFCGTNGRLQLALPEDIKIICGEWNTGPEPELYSIEEEVVLTVVKITNHEQYSSEGPGAGSDIAVYQVILQERQYCSQNICLPG